MNKSAMPSDWLRRYGVAAGVIGLALLTGGFVWSGSVSQTLTGSGLLPHGVCYTWNPQLIGLHLVSDVLIGIAYFSIPATIMYFVRKRRDLPFNWMFALFGVFIIACGLTHWMEVVTLWAPQYWIAGALKAVTAVASVATAIALVWLVPQVMAMPSVAQLRDAKSALEAEVAERRHIEQQLRDAQEPLEARVGQRTRDLAAAQAESQQKSEWLEVTLSSIGDAVIATGRSGEITLINKVAAELTGWPPEAAIGQPIEAVFRTFNEQTREPTVNPALRAIEQDTTVGLANQTVLVARDNCETPIDDCASPIHDRNGNILGAVLIFRNIAGRQQMERRFRQIVEYSPGAIVMVGEAGVIVMVNSQTEKMFGYPRHELLGQSIDMLVPERFRHAHPGLRHGFFAAPGARAMGAGRDLYALRRDGSEFPVEIGLNPIETEEGPMVLSAIVDITRRKDSDLQQARLAAIVSGSDDAIISKGLDGIVWTWNKSAERLFGYSEQEMIGRPILQLIPAERRNEEAEILARIARGELVHHFESVRRASDGRLKDVSIALSPIRLDGKIVGASTIVRDIAERKQREERIRAALAEKELLLSEIHHRVKNNLQVIDSLLDLQVDRIEDLAVRGILRDSQNRIRSMLLIHQTLYQSHDFARVDFQNFIGQLVPALIESYAVDASRIAWHIDAGRVQLPINVAIPCGLIVNELVTNALKHGFPEGAAGNIWVGIGLQPTGEAILMVSNDGVPIVHGIDFATSGTLGMRLVNLLTRQIGGRLEVLSAGATRFRVCFFPEGGP
jgi:PAS domain S-box-containing protein